MTSEQVSFPSKPRVPTLSMSAGIPLIIHQTFPTKILPKELQENVDRLKAMNPEWEYRFYDDFDMVTFVETAYGAEIAAYFARIEKDYGVVKADLFRYLVVYMAGGVYLDIKSSFNKPIREVILPDDRYLLCGWPNEIGQARQGFGLFPELENVPGGEFQQWHIVAASGHPFLKAVIEKVLHNIDVYKPWLHGTGVNGVLRLSGPIAYTLAIYPLMSQYPHRYARNNEDFYLEYSVLKTSHKRLFKKHYLNLTGSIIRMQGMDRFFSFLYVMAKRVKRASKSIVSAK